MTDWTSFGAFLTSLFGGLGRGRADSRKLCEINLVSLWAGQRRAVALSRGTRGEYQHLPATLGGTMFGTLASDIRWTWRKYNSVTFILTSGLSNDRKRGMVGCDYIYQPFCNPTQYLNQWFAHFVISVISLSLSPLNMAGCRYRYLLSTISTYQSLSPLKVLAWLTTLALSLSLYF